MPLEALETSRGGLRRRDFVIGSALSLGLARAHAQSPAKPPLLGWLMPWPPTNPPQGMPFLEALVKLGWIDGKTIQIERRYVTGDAADRAAALEAQAREIVALGPDVIFTATSPAVDAIRRQTSTIPIVFIGVNNPLGAHFIASLAHPGGNITGFATVEPTTIGKMIGLLKEVAPRIRSVALMYSNVYAGGGREWIVSEETTDQAAKNYSVELVDAPVENEGDIDRAFARFGEAKSGEDQTTAVIILADAHLLQQRNLIVTSAAKHRIPAIYPFPIFPSSGGLMSYGSNLPEQFRQAAGYVDRILKGAHPGDLPAQMPTGYELIINMKTANALGITVPASLISTADRVIE
jgi:putative tryptophan/tyrosine transport system substrate-binding protein